MRRRGTDAEIMTKSGNDSKEEKRKEELEIVEKS